MSEDSSETNEGSLDICTVGEEEEGKLAQEIPTRIPSSHIHAKKGLPVTVDEGRFLDKPPLSYIALIAKAILSSPTNKLNLAAIYKYIEDNFPFYRKKDRGWRNSVRHNLSLNDCFIKVGRCEDGKGNYWSIHPSNLNDFVHGDFRQHRRSRKRGHQKEVEHCLAVNYFTPWGHYPSCPAPNWLYQTHYFLDPLWKLQYADRLQFVHEYQKWNVNSHLIMGKFSPQLQTDKPHSTSGDWFYGSPATSVMQQNIFLNIQPGFPNSLLFFSQKQHQGEAFRHISTACHIGGGFFSGYRRRLLEAAEQKCLIQCAEAHVHGCIKDLSGLACSDTVREKKKKRETLKASLRDGAIGNEMKMQMSQSHRNNSGSIKDTD